MAITRLGVFFFWQWVQFLLLNNTWKLTIICGFKSGIWPLQKKLTAYQLPLSNDIFLWFEDGPILKEVCCF